MKNPIRKAFFLGVCAAAVTKRFVEHEVRKYADRSGISEAEGKKIVNDVMKTLKKEKASIEKTFSKEIKKGLKEAKPLVHEGALLAKEVAAELVKEARSTTRKTAKKIVVRARKGAKAKVRDAAKKVRKIKKTVKLARKKVSSMRKKASAVRKKVRKIVKKARR